MGALALLVLQLSRPDSADTTPHFFDLPLAGFLGWSALSMLWAHNRYEAAAALLPWAACAIVYVLVSRSGIDAGGARLVLIALFAAGVGVALLGLAQQFLGLTFVYQAVPPAATFVHKNVAAQFVVAVLPLGLLLAAGTPVQPGAGSLQPGARPLKPGARGREWMMGVLGAGLMVSFVFHTLTRSAWLAAAAEAVVLGAAMLCFREPRAGRRWLAVAAGSFLILALIASGAGSRLREARARLAEVWDVVRGPGPAAGAEPAFTSVRHRQVIWLNTLAMARDAPIAGVGLGNHKVQYPAYARRAAVDRILGAEAQLDYVHNDYLQVLAELGLVGAALAAWLLIAVFRACRRLLAAETPPLRVLGAALTASMVGILVDALFSFPFQRALPPFLLAVHLGLLDRLLAPAAPLPATRRAASWTVAVAGVALVAAAILGARWIASDRHVLQMLRAEARGDWPQVVTQAQAARRLNTYRKEPLFSLGTAFLAGSEPVRARVAFDHLLARYPHDMLAYGNRAIARSNLGDTKGALEDYERVRQIAPEDERARQGEAQVHFRRGLDALRAGGREEARTSFICVLELVPQHSGAHKALGILLYEDPAHRAQAVAHLRRALELNPADRDAPRLRAMLEGTSSPPPTAPPGP